MKVILVIAAVGVTLKFSSASKLSSGVHSLDTECTHNSNCTLPFSYCDFESLEQCQVGICKCQATHVANPENDGCLPAANYFGDSCSTPQQCVHTFGMLSECRSGTCECLPSAVQSDQQPWRCLNKRRLGEQCEDVNQCNHTLDAECIGTAISKRCQCGREGVADQYLPNEAETACFKAVSRLGESCKDNEGQCGNLENSFCDPVTKTCQCNNDTNVWDPDAQGCLPKVHHLESVGCQYSVQCQVENSVCEGSPKVCNCGGEYIQSEIRLNTCIPTATFLGNSCNESVQCVTSGNTMCLDNICQCKPGYLESSLESCSKPINIGEYCSNFGDGTCVDSTGSPDLATCSSNSGKCECAIDRHENNGICHPEMRLGSTECHSTDECVASIRGGVVCDKSKLECVCDDGYREDDPRTCVQAD